MRARISLFLAAAAIAVGLSVAGATPASPSQVEAASAPAITSRAASVAALPRHNDLISYNCAQSSGWGKRVCYDVNQEYFFIYTADGAGVAPSLQFPSNSYFQPGKSLYRGTTGVFEFPGNPYLDEAVWNGSLLVNLYKHNFTTNQHNYVANIANAGVYDALGQIGLYGGNHNYVVWYLQSAGYEFVITRFTG